MSFDLDKEPLEEAAERAGELFSRLYRGLESRRVDPGCTPEELAPRFEQTLVDEGVGLLAALQDFGEMVVPASMATPHPMYLSLIHI